MTDDMKEMLYKVGGMGNPKGRYPRIEEDDDTQVYKRPWVGLTEEDRREFAAPQYGWEDLLIAAEAKLKERNT